MSEGGVRVRALALAVVLAIAAAVLAGPAAPPAGAHGEGSQDIRTVIERTSPALPGISVRTVSSAATALEVVNRGSEPVEVLTDRGVPFLRIRPDGVEANVNAREWYASGNPDGAADPPPEARIGGPVRWERVSRSPGWTWFEHRLHPSDATVPPGIRESGERRRFGDWKVPLRVGGRPAAIEGYIEYRPLLGQLVPAFTGSSTPAAGVVGAVLPGPVPGIFLDTTSSRERVTVLGASGEPFLRFGPRGVAANLHSPTHQADQRVRGEQPAAVADPRARPRWREVAEDARYSWVETRARYPREQPPDAVVDAGRRRKLLDWTVPLEVGGRRAELRGATSWVPAPREPPPGSGPLRGRGPALWLAGLALLTALALGGAAFVGRRGKQGTSAG